MPIAQAAASVTAGSVGPAVLVILAIAGIWWISTHGKGAAGHRLIAWLLLPAIVWALVASHNPAEGGHIASGAASGVSTAIGAIGKLFAGI